MDGGAGGLPWRFSQCFGEKGVSPQDVADADVLSAVSFSPDGEFLATGDKGGRIVVFQQKAGKTTAGKGGSQLAEYGFYSEFQSHEPEFDYLKSLEIEEKINSIRWCRNKGNGLHLISTNDKTIKLWRIYERRNWTISENNLLNNANDDEKGSWNTRSPQIVTRLKVPKVTKLAPTVVATPRRVFANAHAYHINSVSVNSDGETFLSADDLRINLWNLDISDESFTVVDIKPENMEELTEVITAACFHPSKCNLFVYSSSRGGIKMGDMREAALCDKHAKHFEVTNGEGDKSFFSEIIASISDVKFTHDGQYIVSRDYLTLKVWDVRMESKPAHTIKIHEHLRSKLCDLYENDCIFDKYEVAVGNTNQQFMTGSYNNTFHLYNTEKSSTTRVEAGKDPSVDGSEVRLDGIDFGKKMLHTSWHPKQNALAIAGLNNLFIYST